MNFKRASNNLEMAGQGAGLIKGQARSRMERILDEDD